MKRLTFEKLASLMVIMFLGAMTKTSLAEEGQWTKKADMPTARGWLSTSVVDGKIYAIGGAGFGGILATVEEYDPRTDKWTKKTDMPTPRWAPFTSVVDGKIYAIGGHLAGNVPVAAVEEYDPTTDKWKKKANMPTPRGFLSTSVVDGKIYAIGGWDGRPFELPTVEEYDPAMDKWTKKANMPTARECLSTSVVNGKIYAIGGWLPGVTTIVEEYNPKTDKWTKKADMPTARWGSASSVVKGKIYVIGGTEGGLGQPPNVILATMEMYDPATDIWTTEADMPMARHGLSASVVNGKIYVIGSYQPVKTPVVEEYDTGSRAVEAKGKLPTLWGQLKVQK